MNRQPTDYEIEQARQKADLPAAVCESALAEFDPCTVYFGHCVPPCKSSDMDPVFLKKLQDVAKETSLYITSAYRSVDYEKSKRRSGSSSHCKGLAVDIATPNHLTRLILVRVLLAHGFRRIGIAKTYIHVDMDATKSPSIWLYDPNNNTKTF